MVVETGPLRARALEGVTAGDAAVLLLGLEQADDDRWAALPEAGVQVERVARMADAVRARPDLLTPIVPLGG